MSNKKYFLLSMFSFIITFLLIWTITDMWYTFTGANKTHALGYAEYYANSNKLEPDLISCIDTGECFIVFIDKTSIKLKCPTITNKESVCKEISRSKIED